MLQNYKEIPTLLKHEQVTVRLRIPLSDWGELMITLHLSRRMEQAGRLTDFILCCKELSPPRVKSKLSIIIFNQVEKVLKTQERRVLKTKTNY